MYRTPTIDPSVLGSPVHIGPVLIAERDPATQAHRAHQVDPVSREHWLSLLQADRRWIAAAGHFGGGFPAPLTSSEVQFALRPPTLLDLLPPPSRVPTTVLTGDKRVPTGADYLRVSKVDTLTGLRLAWGGIGGAKAVVVKSPPPRVATPTVHG